MLLALSARTQDCTVSDRNQHNAMAPQRSQEVEGSPMLLPFSYALMHVR